MRSAEVLAAGLLVPTIALSPLVWRERAPMPLPRAGYMAGESDGKLVLAGGSYWSGGRKTWSARTDFYDPARDAWEAGPPLPQPRSDAACLSIGGALHVFGGGAEGAVTAEVLRLHGGRWEALAPLPAPRLYPAAVAVGGTVYLLGGLSRPGDYGSVEKTVWALVRGRWKPMPPMPGPPRLLYAAAAAGGRIYIFGGMTAENGAIRNLDDAWVFDPAAAAWSELPRLPVARRAWWAVADAGRVLLLGGYGEDFSADIYAFDPPSGAVRLAGSLPHALADAKFISVGRRLIGAGGESGPRIRGAWTLETRL